tara:strand:+ start:646 stop:909 length:264 start_codon:yes stop_codon:yes gene_type:complete
MEDIAILGRDLGWRLECKSMIESGNFSNVQERYIPHYWDLKYQKEGKAKLTCREFIEIFSEPIIENRQKISQDGEWWYDESFALKTI